MSWSPTQYTQFESERNRPIQDLLARIASEPITRIADLGCGPGNSTQLLGEKFPHATLMGIDNSAAMIEAARQRLTDVPFELDDIATWRNPGPFDLIFANASLQWVSDHAALLPFLVSKLSPGGTLAVQMPDNLDEPAHRLMREMATTGPWAHKLAGARSGARSASPCRVVLPRTPEVRNNYRHMAHDLLSPTRKRSQ